MLRTTKIQTSKNAVQINGNHVVHALFCCLIFLLFNRSLFAARLKLEIYSDVVNKIVVVIMIITHAGSQKVFHINYTRTSHFVVV